MLDSCFLSFLLSLSSLEISEEDKYIVNLNISTCLESTGPCLTDTVVLKDAVLPKHTCDWDFEFVDTGKYFNQ